MHYRKKKDNRIAGFVVEKHKFINISILHKYYDTRVYYRWQVFLEKSAKNVVYINCDYNISQTQKNYVKCSEKYKMFSLINILYYQDRTSVLLFHDPIIMLLIPFLFLLGFRNFVFDSHEDVEKDILIKEYINKYFRSSISRLYILFLKMCIKIFNLKIISPSVNVSQKYDGQIVYNFPYNNTLINNEEFVNYNGNKKSFGYFGTLTSTRSIDLLIDVFKERDEFLYLIGKINDINILESIKNLPKNIIYIEDVPLDKADQYFNYFDVGFCIPTLTTISHDALPVKILEYYFMNKIIISSKIQSLHRFEIDNIYFTNINKKDLHDAIDNVNNIQSANFNKSIKNKYRFENQLCVD